MYLSHGHGPVKLTHLWEAPRKERSEQCDHLHTESGAEKSEVKTWILKSLVGVPNLLDRIDKSGVVGESVVEIEIVSPRFG